MPLHGIAARLDLVAGVRPVLYLGTAARAEDVCRAMTEALLVLTFGVDIETSARQVPHLRQVVPHPREPTHLHTVS